MTALQVLEDFFFIQRDFLTGNHFVYRGPAPVLIDTGFVDNTDQTLSLIQELGVDPARVGRIVNTHTHYDHCGANRIIQERSGCEILLSRVGRHFVDTRNDWAMWWRYYTHRIEYFECSRGLEDGEVVEVGPYEFEVLLTPGHAADGLVLYNRRHKLLLSSDTLWETDMAMINVRVEGSRALFFQLESLERLEGLEIETVYPGHGRPFGEAGAAIARAKSRVRYFLDHPDKLGADALKKIIVYSLLTFGSIRAEEFESHCLASPWFRETVDLYFGGRYKDQYGRMLAELTGRGLIRSNGTLIYSPLRPE